jgi:hypothetical protein
MHSPDEQTIRAARREFKWQDSYQAGSDRPEKFPTSPAKICDRLPVAAQSLGAQLLGLVNVPDPQRAASARNGSLGVPWGACFRISFCTAENF